MTKYVEYCSGVWIVDDDYGDTILISHTSDGRETVVRKDQVRELEEADISDSAEDL